MKLIAQNKKAFFEYDILEKMEAGLVLTGDEVKSIRAGQISLIGAYAVVTNGELFLLNCTIAPYKQAYTKRDDLATRSRKLLLSKREISTIIGDISRKGVTVVPLSLYFNKRNFIKVELGICKSKKAAGKKAAIKERDLERQTRREVKDVYKY
jgi:SsrA-binding protein